MLYDEVGEVGELAGVVNSGVGVSRGFRLSVSSRTLGAALPKSRERLVRLL